MQAGSRDAPHFFVFSNLTMQSTNPTSGAGHVPPSQTPPSTQGSPLTHAHYGPVTSHPSIVATSHAPTAQMLATNVNLQAVVSQPQSSGSQPLGKLKLQLLTSTKEYVIPASITTTSSNVPDSFDTAAFIEELRLVEQRTPKNLGAAVLGGQTLVKVKYVLSSAPDVVATLHLTPDDKLHSAKIRSILWDIKTWRKVTFDVGAAASTSGIVPSSRARTPPAVNNPRPPQRPRIDAGTTTTSTSLPSSTTGSSTPATVHTAWRGLIGLDRLEAARDTASQQLVAALQLPSQWSQRLATANFTLIKREEFTPDEDLQWRQLHPGETQAERDNGRYYRITMPGNSIMINQTPLNTSLIQTVQAVTDAKAAVAFFDRLGTMPTPQELPDGANYFHLNPNRWQRAQPPNTDPVDANHAFLLSNVMGEPIAASQFASLARDETDPLKRMQVVSEEALGGRAKLREFQFHDQQKLISLLKRPGNSRLVVEFHGFRDQGGVSAPQHLLLRRDRQQQWRILTPGQGWQPLHNGESLPTNIGENLWKDAARDTSKPIRILGTSGPGDTTPESVGRRLRATYHTMCVRTPEIPASPGAKAVRNELITRIVRDERGFETNDSALRRLRTETQRIAYKATPHNDLQNLADDLATRPIGPKTFDELHRTGALDGEMEAHLVHKFSGDMRKVNLQMPYMRALSRVLEQNFLLRSRGTNPLGKQVTLSTRQYVVSKETKEATAAFTKEITDVLSQNDRSTGETGRIIRFLAHHMRTEKSDTTPLENLKSNEFDNAARDFLDHRHTGERAKPFHEQSKEFIAEAHALAHIHYAAFKHVPMPRMQAGDRAAHGTSHPLYRYRSNQPMSSPQPQ